MPNNNNGGGGQTPWVTGDVITAERLNGMMGVVLELSGDSPRTLDKTYGEIVGYLEKGVSVVIMDSYGQFYGFSKLETLDDGGTMKYLLQCNGLGWNFLSGTADEYPTENLD